MPAARAILATGPGRRLPPLLWMAAIFVVSGQPSIPSAPDALLDLLIKKALHALAYAILAWLWWRALGGGNGHGAMNSAGRRAALVLAICAVYAASDEWHQTFVPGRSGRATDVLIDIAGAGAAVAVLARWPSLDPLARSGSIRDNHSGRPAS